MSHFAVAVILKDINDLEKTLAPFDESIEVEPYIEKTFQQLIQEGKDIKEKINQDEKLNEYEESLLKCKTDEDYLRAYYEWWKDEEKFDYEHNLLSTYNPNSKWDWWVLCSKGEYARYIDENIPKGYGKLKDFNKDINPKNYDNAIRFWEMKVEGKEPITEEDKELLKWDLYNKEYYIKVFGTKESYAINQATPHYCAFVLEGEWYEKGKMGWFGFSSATKNSIEAYLEKWKEVINEPKYQDYYIAIVDCHI